MLAIIIPYYKRAFFDATLKSLAEQTDKRFKVYIGDDASPEDCSKLLEKYKEYVDFVYHRFDINLGGHSLTKQWERCIDLSAGEEWIMILGDDDKLELNVVSAFYDHLNLIKEKKIQLIRFASKVVTEEQSILIQNFTHPEFEIAEKAFYRKFKGLTSSRLSEYVFSREAYNKHRFVDYPLAWYSDDRAWLDFSDNSPIFTINKVFVEIKVTHHSISGNKNLETLKEKAKLEFYNDLVSNSQLRFTKNQKAEFLLYYGELLKNKNIKSLRKVVPLVILLIKNRSYYDALRLIRRIYYLNK